jgi:hypothetical protein
LFGSRTCTYRLDQLPGQVPSKAGPVVRIPSINTSSRYSFYLVAISTSHATRCTKAKRPETRENNICTRHSYCILKEHVKQTWPQTSSI